MKTKQFPKRLLLNKKTVANLNPNSMSQVKGGTAITRDFCNTDISCINYKCDYNETEYTGCGDCSFDACTTPSICGCMATYPSCNPNDCN